MSVSVMTYAPQPLSSQPQQQYGAPQYGAPQQFGAPSVVVVNTGGSSGAPDGSAAPTLANASRTMIAAAVFALLAGFLGIGSVAAPWASFSYSILGQTLTFSAGLTSATYCVGSTCETYAYSVLSPSNVDRNFQSTVSALLLVTTVASVGAALICIGLILHFLGGVSTILSAIALTRSAATNQASPHGGCFGTALTSTALNASGFAILCVGVIIGSLSMTPLLIVSAILGGVQGAGGGLGAGAIVCGIVSMSCAAATKCSLRARAAGSNAGDKAVLEDALGNKAEACCCC